MGIKEQARITSLDLSVEALRGERKETGVREEWWFVPHPLVLNQTATIVGGGVEQEVMPLLEATKEELYSYMSWAYLVNGGEAWSCQEGGLVSVEDGRAYLRPEEPIARVVMINPVFLGKLPIEVDLTLGFLKQERPAFFDGRSREYKEILREHLPERRLPLIRRQGKGMAKALNVKKELRLHPNFINLVFIEDEKENIKNLPYRWLQHFGWSLMAKIGAFKNLIVPYRKVDEQLRYDLILNSLEGAHPLLPLEELPRRLMAFGSAQEMGEWEGLKGVMIPEEVWRNLPEIKGLMSFSQFCGEYNLLSPPVELRGLVKSRILGRYIERLAGYSRQAEGAFVTFVPSLDEQLNGFLRLPWTGFHLATISGRFGTVKTNLAESDFAAIGAFFEGGKVGVIPVEGIDLRGPSIEVYELIDSQNKLVEKLGDGFLMGLRRVEGGYVYDSQGSMRVPGIRGVFHGHRLYQVLRTDKVLVVPVGRKEFPPFPCGSDKMHELSRYGMRKAQEMWEKGGRQAVCAVVELPNHGSHLLFFWTANESGIIPQNPAEQMKEVFERRYLVPIEEVEQR